MQLTPDSEPQRAFARAIAHLDPPGPWAVAVSGGPDSTALMHLASDHARRRSCPPPLVLTVDHGLRPSSASEAREVASAANALGLTHRILNWTGDKPAHGIQQAARLARYRLLAQACERAGALSLFTGHTRDDQIETIQMRRDRASGPLGLAGMPAQSDLPHTQIRLVRPLLAVPKAHILGWLDAASTPYIVDPSNSDRRFERARLRQAPLSDPVPASDILAVQQTRMRLEQTAGSLLSASLIRSGGRLLLPESVLADAQDDLADLLLAVLLRAAGGRAYPGTRAERVRLIQAIRDPGPFTGRTLAGAIIRRARRAEASAAAGMLVFEPETGGKLAQTSIWLPFAQYNQTGIDGELLTISTIFTVR